MAKEQWDVLTEKVIGVLPEEAKQHQWQKYPDLLKNRLQDALVRGPESVDEWVVFFESVFGYNLNKLEVSIGIKPPYPCASIVVPRDDFGPQMWRKRHPEWKTNPPLESCTTQVYERCLEIFPYDRWTPKPLDFWNGTNYFNGIDDIAKRPPKPYLIWVKTPDFDWREERKITWEARWDSPGPTLQEQMLLDLFWWDKYKKPFGNSDSDWKNTHDHGRIAFLCSGSEFREGRWPDEKYYKETCCYKRLMPATVWGCGGWYVSSFGYRSATTPSPYPCFVTF